tara:strand:- start:92 stop:427 length:336 start_codon:yes stop_codon:yes gene_type:complete
MSQQSYLIEGAVSDGDFISSSIAAYWERSYISITFYSDAAFTTPVTPSAGVVTITATDDGFNYGTITSGTVDVSIERYDRPNMSGRLRNIKATLSGVTGATHFRVIANQYN